MSPDTLRDLSTPSARLEREWLVTVHTPEDDVQTIIDAVTKIVPLKYGDYDRVAFRSNAGVQQFRPLAGSKLGRTEKVYKFPVVELVFSMPQDLSALENVFESVFAVHVAEEPVIYVQEVWSTRSIGAEDDANPNRFWNRDEYKDL